MATRRRPAVSVDAPASEPGSVAAVELTCVVSGEINLLNLYSFVFERHMI